MLGVDPEGVYYNLREVACTQCLYSWFPRKVGEVKDCPSCRSTDWNNGKKFIIKNIPVINCPKCGHKWSPYSTNVKECPKCKKVLFKLARKPV